MPSAKIESVRFRSVAFKKPTAELPTDDGKTKPKPTSKVREHDRSRAASWRGEDKDEADATPAKRFLTPQEKKRVAYIKHEIHEQVDGWGYDCVFTDNTLYMDQPYGAVDTDRRMYVVDGWFASFSVKNNMVDYGAGLVEANSWEYYNSDYVTYLE